MDNSNKEIPTGNFLKLAKINTIAATPSDISFEQIKQNIKRPHMRLHEMASFKVPKGPMPIALVGGGPSLSEYVHELNFFDGVVVACGSAYDYLIEQNIVPTYCVLCDPDEITAAYITKPNKATTFLVATQCHSKVFETLKGYAIIMWHCYNEEFERFKEIDPTFQAVGGGCTVGLRALSIAIMLGYSNIHFYGFDSCLGVNNHHHAYSFNANEELGELYIISLDINDPKQTFVCAGYHLAQVQHFQEFFANYHGFFKPVFHGTGLLPAMMQKMNDAIALAKTKESNLT